MSYGIGSRSWDKEASREKEKVEFQLLEENIRKIALEAGVPTKVRADGALVVRCSQATANYILAKATGQLTPTTLPLLCHCKSFRFSHSPEAHRQLKGDWDWRSWEERERKRHELSEWL